MSDFFAFSHILDAVAKVRSTASVDEVKKILKCHDLLANYIFHPVAFKTSGEVRKLTARFLSLQAARLVEITGKACEAISLFQCINCNNAANVLACFKSH